MRINVRCTGSDGGRLNTRVARLFAYCAIHGLAWSALILTFLPAVNWTVVRDAAGMRVVRSLLIARDIALPTILFVCGCALLWWLGHSKRSRFVSLAPILAVGAVLTAAMDPFLGWASSDLSFFVMHLPIALASLLSTLAVMIAMDVAERPVERKDISFAVTAAVVATLVSLIVPLRIGPIALRVAAYPLRLVWLPALFPGVALGAGLEILGVPGAFTVGNVVVVLLVWFGLSFAAIRRLRSRRPQGFLSSLQAPDSSGI